MEEETPQPTAQPQQPPVAPETPTQSRLKLISVMVGIVAFIVVGTVAYWAGTQSSNQALNDVPPTITTSRNQLSNQSETTTSPKQDTIPESWSMKKSEICDVTIPFPPKEEPYYIPENPDSPPGVNDEGSFWQYHEGYGSTRVSNSAELFEGGASVRFTDPEKFGSGYIGGKVSVACSPNTENYTIKTLVAKIESDIASEIPKDDHSVQIVSKREDVMWGMPVMIVRFRGAMYSPEKDNYFLATENNIYFVSTHASSPLQIVQDTTQLIFYNLLFDN